jgi:hypothetical protein
MKLKAYDVAFTVPPITSNYLMSPESDVVFVRLLADCVVGMSPDSFCAATKPIPVDYDKDSNSVTGANGI